MLLDFTMVLWGASSDCPDLPRLGFKLSHRWGCSQGGRGLVPR